MLNRNGLITSLKMQNQDREDKNEEKHIPPNTSFLIINIAGFRDLDLAKDANGFSQADIAVNMIAKELNVLMRSYNVGGKRLICARIGGDEFAIAMIGLCDEEKAAIKNIVESTIKNIKVPPVKPDEEPKSLSLKDMGDNAIINVPEGGFKKRVFEQIFFQSGIIPDESELTTATKICSNYQEEQNGQESYPENGICPIDNKLLDCLNSLINAGCQIDITEIIEFTRQGQVDRLLDDVVESVTIFHEKLLTGQYRKYFCIDLKLIKELNDTIGLAYADKLIKNFYRKISKAIIEDDREKVDIFRRGGTFVVAVKTSSEALNKGYGSKPQKNKKDQGSLG